MNRFCINYPACNIAIYKVFKLLLNPALCTLRKKLLLYKAGNIGMFTNMENVCNLKAQINQIIVIEISCCAFQCNTVHFSSII